MALKLEVMDKDTVGADDSLGSVILPLSSEGIQSGWFSLEGGSGSLQLCAGFGDIACAPKLSPFQKVQCNIESARHLPALDLGLRGKAKSDPYVKVWWRSDAKMEWVDTHKVTRVLEDTLKPEWNQQIEVDVGTGSEMAIRLQVWDRDTSNADDHLGFAVVTLSKGAVAGDFQHGWLELEGGSGSIQAAIGLFPFEAPEPLPVSVMVDLEIDVEEARNLIAADLGLFSGRSSDPYVHIFWRSDDNCPWEDSGITTKVVKKTLNPSWAEHFSLQVEGGAHIQIKLQVFDKDAVSKDDSLGYILVELSTLEPYVQGWQPMKGGSGELRVFARIQGYGPPPIPRVTAHLKIQCALDLKPTDKDLLGRESSDPYVTIHWRRDCESPWVETNQKTKVVANTLDPVWEEEFVIEGVERTEETGFKLTVWDSDLLRDDLVGEIVLQPGWCVDVPLMQFELLPPGLHEVTASRDPANAKVLLDEHDEGNLGYLELALGLPLAPPISPDGPPGVICGPNAEIERIAAHIAVHRARNLECQDVTSLDPFFRLHWRGMIDEPFEDLGPEYESRFIANTDSPVFKWNGSFEVEQLKGMALLVEMFSFSYEGKDHFLGAATVEVGYCADPIGPKWFPVTLTTKGGQVITIGEVEVSVTLLGIGAGTILPYESDPSWFLLS